MKNNIATFAVAAAYQLIFSIIVNPAEIIATIVLIISIIHNVFELISLFCLDIVLS